MKTLHRYVLGVLLAALAVGAGFELAEARNNDLVLGPFVGQSIHSDVSPPMRDVKGRPSMPPGFAFQVPHRKPRGERPADRPGRQDPLRQTSSAPTFEAAMTMAPGLSFEGLSDDDNAATIGGRVVPPDTNGDIGPDHYVQTINSIWAVWNISRAPDGTPTGASMASGYPKGGNSFWTGFGGPCEANNDGDPIVLYDHLADRWFVSQFSINEGIQCVAMSTGPDPTGTYYRYAFTVSPGENNDYPKFGMMPDAYYLTLRDFPSNDGTFASFVAFDRSALLTGGSVTTVKYSLACASANCPDGVQPPHLEGPAPGGSTPGIFTRFWDDDYDGPRTGSDGVRMWTFTPDFATPANSLFGELPFVAGAGFDSSMCGFFQRGCIPQPRRGGGERLDPADELQMYRAQYRSFTDYDSIVLSTTVDASGDNFAGMRWAELRNGGSGWVIHQEGTYAPDDGDHRWMGSVAMNGEGAIALGYSVSGTGTFPSIRYTSRCEDDTLGEMTGGEEEMMAGAGVQTSSYNRWGDYSSMSVDPVDDTTFWYTQQYYANTGSFDFKTRIGAFSVDCSGGSGCTADEIPETSCSDGNDNDCDGLIDAEDPDCEPSCVLGDEICEDGCDNDGDGFIDADDSDCAGLCIPTSDRERGRRKCGDGVDNDCDGLIDSLDPDC
jgi:hypothetical protein